MFCPHLTTWDFCLDSLEEAPGSTPFVGDIKSQHFFQNANSGAKHLIILS